MARSITFVIEDKSQTRLTITEQDDGTLLFEIESLGIDPDDLRALFFDIGEAFEGLLDGLSVAGGDVTDSQFEADDVSNLGTGANVNGWIIKRYGEFDAGIEFGTAGKSRDLITSTSFVLSHSSVALDLDMIDEQDFAIRTTSAGDKAVGQSSAAILAADDLVGAAENAVSALSNLLDNDRASAGLVVSGASHNGAALTLGAWNTLTTDAGRTVNIFVAADGSFQADATSSDFDTLAVGETDTITIAYASVDGASSTDDAFVTVTITGTNDAPVATDDLATADESGSAVVIDVLANDTDIDADDDSSTLVVVAASTASGASVTFSGVPGEGVVYDPASTDAFEYLAVGETATDTITYTIEDSHGAQSTATVTVTVVGTNDAPVALDLDEAVGEDGPTISIVPVYSDVDASDTHTLSIDTTGTQGNAFLNGDGTIAYDPLGYFDYLSVGETATDTFTYTVDDGNGGTSTATVTVTITGVNDAVFISNAATTIGENEPAVTFHINLYDLDANDTHTWSLDDSATLGTVTHDGNGNYTYDPGTAFDYLAAGEVATDTFVYSATDGNGSTDTKTAVITITGQNDAPVALAVSGAADEDGPAITVAADYSDVDASDTHTFSVDTTGTLGAVTDNGDGTFDYSANGAFEWLAAGETTTDSFSYTVDDGNGGTDTKTVTITITGQNDAPVALDLDEAVGEDGPTISIVPVYSDVDASDTHTLSIDTTGTQGNAFLNGDGTIAYDPLGYFDYLSVGETATDTFTYTVDDGNGGTSTATVTVTITGVNDAVFISNAATTIGENEPAVTFHINLYDLDANDTHTWSLDDSATLGTVTHDGNGNYTYDPGTAFDYLAAGEVATDTFVYSATDGNGSTDTKTAVITITGQNDAPVALAVSGAADEDGPAITVAADYSDVDASDTHTFSVDTTGTLGAVTDNGDGTFDYSANGAFEWLAAGETTTDSFSYTVDDGNGGTDTKTVTITITGQNDGPVAVNDDVQADESGAAAFFDVLANDTDIDSNDDASTLRIVSAVSDSGATVTFSGAPGAGLSYDPSSTSAFESLAVGETGQDVISYTIEDSHGVQSSAYAIITVVGTNDAPVAVLDNVSTDENATLWINPLANDTDVDNGAVLTVTSATLAQSAVGGSVQLVGNQIHFDPGSDFDYLALGENRIVRIDYAIEDEHGAGDTAFVLVNVIGTNDGPVAVADASEEDADVTHSGNVLANDSDVDATDVLSVSAFANEDGDPGTPGTPLAGKYGTLALAADGTWTYLADENNADVYSLALGDTISETFTYTVDDGNGGTDTATLTVTIVGINTTPTAVDDTAAATEDGAVVSGNVLANDIDPDTGAVLSAALVNPAQPGLTFAADGSWSFDPTVAAFQHLNVGQTIDVIVDYTVTDEKGASDLGELRITVTGTNDGPVAVTDIAGVDEGSTVAIDVLANDTDVDDNAVLTVTSASVQGSAGSVAVVNNQVVFDASTDFEGLALGETQVVTIDYTIEDEHGALSSATVAVTVTGTNDAPTVEAITLDGSVIGVGGGNVVGIALSDHQSSSWGQFINVLVDTNNDGIADAAAGTSVLGTNGSSGWMLDSADMDGDGDIDVLLSTGSQAIVFSNQGDTTGDGVDDFIELVRVSGDYDATFADTDGDGLAEIVTFDLSNRIVEYKNLGDTNNDGEVNFSTAARIIGTSPGGGNSYGIDSGDLNGDGQVDIIASAWSGGPISILLNRGDVTNDGLPDFNYQQIEDAYDESGLGVTIGDIDGDGDNDFVYARWSGQNEVVYINDGDPDGDGNLNFRTVVLPSGGNTMETELADLDGDGDLDVVIASYGGQTTIALNRGDNNGDGLPEFTIHNVGTNTNSYGVAVLDADGDGDIDIIAADVSNSAELLTNIGDTNNDGIPEFVSTRIAGAVRGADVEALGGGGLIQIAQGANEDGDPVTADFAGDDIDSDDDQATLTYTLVGTPSEGTVTNNGDGTFTFDPGADFQDLALGETRTVTFDYFATDQHGENSAIATISIDVAGRNDDPVTVSFDSTGAVSEIAEGGTGEDTTLHSATGTLTFSDVDTSDTHTASIQATASGYLGAISLGAIDPVTGELDWTFQVSDADLEGLAEGEVVTQEYTISVIDSSGGALQETVTVTITGANDSPTAGNIVLQANALGNGGFDTTPDFTGWNVSTATSNLTSVSFSNVTIDRSGNALPGITDDAVAVLDFGGNVPTPFGTGYGPTITSDPFTASAGDTVRFIYELSSGGDYAIGTGYIRDAATGQIVQTIFNYNTGFTGSTGTQTVDLTLSGSGTYTIEFRVGSYDASGGLYVGAKLELGFAGVLQDGVSEDGSFTFGGVEAEILATASDPDGDSPLTITSVTSAFGANVMLNADGSLFYEPAGAADFLADGEEATDTITFVIDDGNGGTTTATAQITVIGENDAPVAGNDLIAINADADTASGNVLDNDSDIDGDALEVLSVRVHPNTGVVRSADAGQVLQGLLGTLTINPDGSLTYDLDNDDPFVLSLRAGASTAEGFLYTVSDGNGGVVEQQVFFSIRGVNDDPDAVDDTFNVSESGSIVLDVLANDTDVDTGTTLAVTAVTQPTDGSVSIDGSGNVVFDPGTAFAGLSAGQTATVSFDYTIDDGNGGTDTATATVTVQGAGDLDAETTTETSTSGATLGNGQEVNLTLTGPSDVDGDADITVALGLGLVVQPVVNIVYIVDISGSTSGAFSGTAVGDLNNDGRANTVLDAEIAALDELTASILDLGYPPGNVTITVIPFNADADPTQAGFQQYGAQTFDLSQAANIGTFLGSLDYGGQTNYEPPLQAAIDTFNVLDPDGTENNFVFFLSDGVPYASSSVDYRNNFQDEAATLHAMGVEVSAFALATNSFDTSYLDQLDNTGGVDVVSTVDDLNAALINSPIPSGEVADFQLFLDGVELTDVDETDLVAGPLGLSLNLTLDDVAQFLGENTEVTATITMTDGTVLTTSIELDGILPQSYDI